MIETAKVNAEETEYVAKDVNRGSDSVDGSKVTFLKHEEIQAWLKAEREYVTTRVAVEGK